MSLMLALPLVLGPQTPALEALTQRVWEGFQPAPAGAWTTLGGSPAGTRNARTVLPRGDLELRWSVQLEGELVGEPLVWGDKLVVEVEESKDRRVRCFDGTNGRELGEGVRTRAAGGARPALWGRRVVLLTEDDELSRYVMSEGEGLRRVGRWTAKQGFGAPILLEQDVFAMRDGDLTRYRFGASMPVWSVSEALDSELRLVDGHLVGLEDNGEHMRVVGFEIQSGEQREASSLGWLQPSYDEVLSLPSCRREDGELLRWTPSPGVAWIDLRGVGGWRTRGLESFPGTGGVFGLSARTGLASQEDMLYLLPMLTEVERMPLPHSEGWLSDLVLEADYAASEGIDRRTLLDASMVQDAPAFQLLGDRGMYPWLFAFEGEPVLSGGALLLGSTGIDLATGDVLFRLEGELPAGSIPTDQGLLLWRAGGRLEAWGAAQGVRPLQAFAPERAGLSEALALDVEGQVFEGRLELEDAEDGGGWELVVAKGNRRKRWSPAEVGFIGLGDASVVHASDSAAFLDGLHELQDRSEAEALEETVKLADACDDAAVMSLVLEAALELGLGGKEVQKLERAIEEAQPGAAPGERDAEVAARMAALTAARADWWWSALERLQPGWEDELAYPLLELALEADPQHAAARAYLTERLPAGFELPPGESPVEWVQFCRIASRIPIEVLRAPEQESAELSRDERRLGVHKRWRPDLIGLRSANLLVITPVARPGSLARVIATGELVAETLLEAFGPYEGERDLRVPLEILLYESQAEYIQQASGGNELHAAALSWTAGHYDLIEHVSRLFLPDGEGELGLEAATETFVHELVHHWIDQRCPQLESGAGKRVHPATPGYWVVEGFASMFGSFEWDVETWTHRETSPRAYGLDLVAMAAKEDLLPWDLLFGWRHMDTQRLSGVDLRWIPTRWTLGRFRAGDATARFYAQAEALCHYLYTADDGVRRAALLAFLIDYYSGRVQNDTPPAEFGGAAEPIGGAVREHATAIVLRR